MWRHVDERWLPDGWRDHSDLGRVSLKIRFQDSDWAQS